MSEMSTFRPLSTSEQLANFLHEQILNGKLVGKMPGVKQLVQSLGVNSDAVSHAITILEHRGLLINRGSRRSPLIVQPTTTIAQPSLKIQILPYGESSAWTHQLIEIRRKLEHAGYATEFSDKTLYDLKMDPLLVKKHVENTAADAWLIISASKPVIQWFASQPVPAFALYGQLDGIPIAGAGPQKSLLMEPIVRNLVQLGHRRITMLCREDSRLPQPGAVQKAFLAALELHGIQSGAYHLPNWGDTREELHKGLNQLFQFTPPTALICSYSLLYLAAQTHLSNRGLRIPDDVSMICLDLEQNLAWSKPLITHIAWDDRPLIRRIVRWAGNVASHKEDRAPFPIQAKLVKGGSVARAKS